MKEKCQIHPNMNQGSCGFYTGYEHDKYPPGKEPKPTKEDRIVRMAKAMGVLTQQEVYSRALDILEWKLAHESAGETQVSLIPRQMSYLTKGDIYGVIRLPRYLKEKR